MSMGSIDRVASLVVRRVPAAIYIAWIASHACLRQAAHDPNGLQLRWLQRLVFHVFTCCAPAAVQTCRIWYIAHAQRCRFVAAAGSRARAALARIRARAIVMVIVIVRARVIVRVIVIVK